MSNDIEKTGNDTYGVARLYMKSASIEVPDMPHLPAQAVQPVISVDFQIEVQSAWAMHIECTLTISVFCKLAGKNMYAVEVAQAGIFGVDSAETWEIAHFAKEVSAEVLFPNALVHLSALTKRAGFQPATIEKARFTQALERLEVRPSGSAAKNIVPAAVADEQIETAPLPELPAASPRKGLPYSIRNGIVTGILLIVIGILYWGIRSERPAPTSGTIRAATPAEIAASEEKQEQLARIESIISRSHARLVEQDPASYTLVMGTLAIPDAIALLEPLPLRRALFVDRSSQGNILVLYGIFPTAALAQAGEAELPEQLPDALKNPALRQALRLADTGISFSAR